MQVSKYAFMRWENLSVAFITSPESIYDEAAGNSDALSPKWFFGSRHNGCIVAIAEIFVQTLGSITGNSFVRILKLKLGCS